MPANHRVDPANRVAYCRAWGAFTDDDLARVREALYADPSFTPDLAVLLDLTGVTDMNLSSQAVGDLARGSGFAPTARRAFVVTSDVAYGMARMFAIFTGHEDTVQVFRDHASAMRWLGLPARP